MKESTNLYSMTGYASKTLKMDPHQVRIQIKSVNHRFFELKWRAPRDLMGLEIKAKSMLQGLLQRGVVELSIDLVESESEGNTLTPQKILGQLDSAIRSVKGISPLLIPPPIRALILARFPDSWLTSRSKKVEFNEDELLKEILFSAHELRKYRQNEGAKIHELLIKQHDLLKLTLERIRLRIPELRKEWESNLKKRLVEFLAISGSNTPSEERIAQEIALLSEKRDVTEEVDRIGIHLSEYLKVITANESEAKGKRLEFVVQELHREWTTLGNKIQNHEINREVVEAKLAIEQIREQSANIL